MKWRATLLATRHGDTVKLLVISPQDDVLFVDHEDAPPEFKEYGENATKGTDMTPVGYLFELELGK